MKRLLLIINILLLAAACQKAPELTVTSPSSIELGVDGSSSTITFTANRDWSVRSSDSWVSVSPSSGTASDEAVTVRVSCSANTTYDDRSATITITMEELTQTVSVKQPANLGIVLPTQSYNLASDARTIDVEVRSNVQYAVSVSDSWIKQTGTKGLVTDKLTFSVEENDTYDGRSATITIKPQNATVQEQVISVKQAQKDALIVKDTSFDMPYGGGEIEVKVEANVSFDVKPSEDWIHYVETKALSGSTVRLTVDENATYSAREGKIEIKQKNGTLSHTLTVKQAGRIAVTSIELNKTSLTLKEGESETLTATVKPDNATDKTVTWSSSAPNIAAVDEAGNVTAVVKGEATITAQAGEKTAKCTVSVFKEIPVSSIELDKNTLSLVVGDEVTLKATVKPDDATDKTITWTSNDTSIAKVDADGKVTAVGKGNTSIIATAGSASATCNVFVKAADYPTPSGAVDLGLSVVWADKNLGASSAYEAGGYYLWGDPSGNGVIMFFETPNTNYICDTQYDIARAKLGKGWRLPTREELKELMSSCTWTKESNGVKLTGPNGQSISLPLSGMAFPADGAIGNTSITSKDKGYLMSGESYADGAGRFAYVYHFDQSFSYNWSSYNAPMAKFPVRAVFENLDGTIPVSSVSLSKTELTLKVGESETLEATVKPDDATDKTVTWTSSNKSIAAVDNTGKVTASNEGTAIITAMAGDAFATCSLTVDNTTVLNGNLSNACFIISQKGEYRILCSDEVSNGANSAFVLWNENGKDDIINLALQGDYVYFEKPSFKKGNAVVSLAKDGVIVKSWHLWSTDEPKFIDGIMDRNLGATSTEPNNEDAYGLMYSYGSPFPFPGAKYKDWTLTSEPSVPDGWYVAPGYGFYAGSKMPTESTPMLYCTSADKYGNSIFWRNSSKYSPCPQGTSVLGQSKLQDIIGYEPSFNGLNGVRLDSGLFIPAAGRQRTQQEKGVRDVGVWGSYWGIGIYNNAAVDARACWFYEGFSKATSYYEGNTLHSIRCRK